MMDENLIVEKFREIKELGFVKSKRPYSTGIGKTFEDYLGVTENNEIGPDFAGFEVVQQAHADLDVPFAVYQKPVVSP